MSKRFLTFELVDDGDAVEIHGNSEGLSELIAVLKTTIEHGEHQHLMTPFYGGSGLSEEKQGLNNQLVNHVKIVPWKSC